MLYYEGFQMQASRRMIIFHQFGHHLLCSTVHKLQEQRNLAITFKNLCCEDIVDMDISSILSQTLQLLQGGAR